MKFLSTFSLLLILAMPLTAGGPKILEKMNLGEVIAKSRDTDEPGLPGVIIYLDANLNETEAPERGLEGVTIYLDLNTVDLDVLSLVGFAVGDAHYVAGYGELDSPSATQLGDGIWLDLDFPVKTAEER